VPAHTAFDVNMDINEKFHRSVAYFMAHPTEIPDRLKKLDREWDVDRALATWSSLLSLLGLGMAASGRKRWLALPLVAQSFHLQHTLAGWSPPLPVLRRAGYRTATEIEREKCALKDLLREQNPNESRSSRPSAARGTGRRREQEHDPYETQADVDLGYTSIETAETGDPAADVLIDPGEIK
jgi:hypothetical protein